MKTTDDLRNDDVENIIKRLDILEQRIASLEANREQVNQIQSTSENKPDDDFEYINLSLSAPFETKLGEYGLAWLGNIVLFFAIIFLWQYFNNAGKPAISLMVGIVSVAAVFAMSHYFKKGFVYLSFMFNLSGYIILYYVILRLHYFSVKPFLTNQLFATVLLLIVIGVQLYFAVKKQSQVLAGIAFTLAIITAFVYDHILGFAIISIATTALVLYSFWKYNWSKTMIFILFISYLVSLIWLLKNPVSLVNTPENLVYHYAFTYFSITTALYSLVVFRKPSEAYPENLIFTTILSAGFAYLVSLLLLVFIHFPNAYVPFFVSISIYCIAYSVILQFYSPWKYSPALYALFGFVSISVAVFGVFHFPDSFLLLTYQSFLVLAFALWYRSHIITLINTFLLLILMVIYYSISGTLNTVNFSIPFVAFLSARIINWQKERLNIKTDFIRNIYLFTLFFSILYATYKGLPKQYITISWLLIGVIYFGLSILLKNIKYRWLAMANLLVSAFYLFLIDLANIDLIYRILAFLVFAVISIVISIYYVKKLKKKDTDSLGE